MKIPPKLTLYKPLDDSHPDRTPEVMALSRLCSILDEYSSEYPVKYWIDWGTLLGAFREGKIIDWDFDIDIGMICNVEDKLWEWPNTTLLQMIQREFFVQFFNPYVNLAMLPHDFETFWFNNIDITFYRHHKKNCVDGCNNKVFRSFYIDELEVAHLYGIPFPVPRHTEQFLSLRYGEDWRVPKKDFAPPGNVMVDSKKYTCYTAIVGDFFHLGHQKLLDRCSDLFDKVIVGVHNDEEVERHKNQRPYNSYEQRLELIKQYPMVDEVFENAPYITTDGILDQLGADFVVAGREDEEKIKAIYPVRENRLHLVERTPGIDSRIMREGIANVV